jgi:magnesium transporter
MGQLPTLDEIRAWVHGENADAIREHTAEAHPNDTAKLLLKLDDTERWGFFRLAEPAAGAKVFVHLPMDRQVGLAQSVDAREMARLLEHVASDDRTDLIGELDPVESQRILAHMAEDERSELERLAAYPEDTVGAVMSTDFVALQAQLTAPQAIAEIRRQARRKETIYYAYVLDARGRLLGSVSLRDLILAKETETVGDLMHTDIVQVSPSDNRQSAAKKIADYDLVAIPVVLADGRLAGLVTVDDVMDVTEEEVTEDFHKMAPITLVGQSMRTASFTALFKMRIPWLLLLVFMNIFSGAGIAYYEGTIEAAVALVFFLPLLIDSGGNAGSQSATLMIRALAIGDVRLRDWMRLLGREIAVALPLGVAMGIAVSFIAMYRADTEIATVVALTMICTVLIGSLIGMSLPFLLGRLKMDPATASAPLVTSLADIAGVLIYFSIATWYLHDRIVG